VTSTRLFCRYTGEEVIGCAEANAPEHAEIRSDQCCQQRTFHALDGVRLVEGQREQLPAPVASDAPALVVDVIAAATGAVRLMAAASVGPPAFLSHRALLI